MWPELNGLTAIGFELKNGITLLFLLLLLPLLQRWGKNVKVQTTKVRMFFCLARKGVCLNYEMKIQAALTELLDFKMVINEVLVPLFSFHQKLVS